MNLYEYTGKRIKITTIRGRVFEGIAQDYTSALDNPDGVNCISIGNIEFEESEIANIEIITADSPVMAKVV